MKNIKCTCGKETCRTELHVGSVSPPHCLELWSMCKEGHETLMYLDANAIVQLIADLKQGLVNLTERNAE